MKEKAGAKILLVEDEQGLREVLKILLENEGHQVVTAQDGIEGMDCLTRDIFDLIITDIKMPGATGYDILRRAQEVAPETLVLIITAFGTVESAIEAMKLGAYDYINKPFKVDEIRVIIRNALDRRRLHTEVAVLRERMKTTYQIGNIVGKSHAMHDVLVLLPRVAKNASNVLIFGESGTGKELVASALFMLSDRAEKNFVTVNCAAFPEGLLESELFGHIRGAFTGAVDNKQGLFEVAHGGTIFLDEIGEMPLSLQSKLLRTIENGTFRRVGGTSDITVDVRVISATNKDLKEEVKAGRFREDLYFRLNVIPINIPPLRERTEDIPVLIEHFMGKYPDRKRQFSGGALKMLMDYAWKGNVRELENIIERVVLFTDTDIITEANLPPEIRHCEEKPDLPVDISGGIDLEAVMCGIERKYFDEALRITAGNKTEAAKLLGLTFRSFRHRLAKYRLRDEAE